MAKGVKVKYFDPSGNARDGYIINNKTYKDPDGNERVELGSVVETADGSYTLTKNGGIKTNVLQENFKMAEDSINSAKSAAQLAIKQKYENQAKDIASYKKEATDYYNNSIAKNNAAKQLSQKKLNQLLKAQGISGGASESSIIANNMFFEENNNELMRDMNKALSDYDNMLLKLAGEMEYDILKSNAEYDSVYADLLTEKAGLLDSSINSEMARNSQNFIHNRDMEAQKEENDRNFERSVYEDERDYERGVFEDDREYEFGLEKFNRDVFESDREYERDVFESDRAYNRDVYEDERDYKREAYESDRSYNLSYSNSKSEKKEDDEEEKEYQRKLKNADVLSKAGDYSGYAELFGWSKEQQQKAEDNYYAK